MARTERESDRRRSDEKWQTCWWCRDQQRACRMVQASAEKLEHVGLLKRKEWPQYHRESSWQVCQSRLRLKEKEKSRLSRVPDHEGGESQGGREPHLGGRERKIRAGAQRENGGLHGKRGQIPRRKGRTSKKSSL